MHAFRAPSPPAPSAGDPAPDLAPFAAAGVAARTLGPADLPALQALFEACTDFFEFSNGVPPPPDAAAVEFAERPPPHLPYSRHWTVGLLDAEAGRLHGALIVVADLGVAGVWHLALMLVHPAQRGSGLAPRALRALEDWARADGAGWLRLGVIRGNTRAERFWAACGFTETRQRALTDALGRERATRVLVKPLAGGTLEDYRAQVPRDRPGAELP